MIEHEKRRLGDLLKEYTEEDQRIHVFEHDGETYFISRIRDPLSERMFENLVNHMFGLHM